jgi:hypothetical protein
VTWLGTLEGHKVYGSEMRSEAATIRLDLSLVAIVDSVDPLKSLKLRMRYSDLFYYYI